MPRKLIRLYLKEPFDEAIAFSLTKEQAHYLGNVMRLKPGDSLRVFANQKGEWHAQISEIHRKGGKLTFLEKLYDFVENKFLGLAFSPLRSQRLSFLIEKATELGVTDFFPVITDQTQQKLPSVERLQAVAIEASEQSERLTVPVFHSPCKLREFIERGSSRQASLIVCDERRSGLTLTTDFARGVTNPLLIIGPEGGFSRKEFDTFEKSRTLSFVDLGQNILRAETAALCALSHFHCAV